MADVTYLTDNGNPIKWPFYERVSTDNASAG